MRPQQRRTPGRIPARPANDPLTPRKAARILRPPFYGPNAGVKGSLVLDKPPARASFSGASLRVGSGLLGVLATLFAAPARAEDVVPWAHLPAVSGIDFKDPILFCLVIFALLVFALIRRARRDAAGIYIRPLAGITAIEEAVGRATEMGRPVLYVPGIDDVNNIQTIYSMVILEKVAGTVAQYGTPLVVPVGKAFVVPMAEETVKQGYMNAGVPDAYNPNTVRYMSDEQFAFTAATNGIILREKPAANIFLGSFYAESLLLAETGFMTRSIQVAGTANVHQLPFFVVACDYTLIGEEFYAATAYLSRQPNLLGTIKAQDYFKIGIIAALVLGFVLETAGMDFWTRWWVF